MPIAHYEAVHKSKVEYQIKQRYQWEISQLEPLGFDDLHFTREVTFPFSAVLFFWMYFALKQNKDIFFIESPLRFVLLNPLLLNFDFDSYCYISNLGTRFATRFLDGTVLISCNGAEGTFYEKAKLKIYKYAPSYPNESILQTWQTHQDRLMTMEQQGFETDKQLTLRKYEEMMQRDDRAILGY